MKKLMTLVVCALTTLTTFAQSGMGLPDDTRWKQVPNNRYIVEFNKVRLSAGATIASIGMLFPIAANACVDVRTAQMKKETAGTEGYKSAYNRLERATRFERATNYVTPVIGIAGLAIMISSFRWKYDPTYGVQATDNLYFNSNSEDLVQMNIVF